jgi:hypothetical protein
VKKAGLSCINDRAVSYAVETVGCRAPRAVNAHRHATHNRLGRGHKRVVDTLGDQFQRFIQVLRAVTWEVPGADDQRPGKARKCPEALGLFKRRRLEHLTVGSNRLVKVLDLLCVQKCVIEHFGKCVNDGLPYEMKLLWTCPF